MAIKQSDAYMEAVGELIQCKEAGSLIPGWTPAVKLMIFDDMSPPMAPGEGVTIILDKRRWRFAVVSESESMIELRAERK